MSAAVNCLLIDPMLYGIAGRSFQRRLQPGFPIRLSVGKLPVFHHRHGRAGYARLLHHFAGNAIDFGFLFGGECCRGLGLEPDSHEREEQ